MLKPSEVLMRAHNEGRVCGQSYTYHANDIEPMLSIPSRVYGQLCALGFLIEPFKAEFHEYYNGPDRFVSEKYGIPLSVVNEIEERYEGWNLYEDNPQPLNVIAEWLEGIGY